jgi:hypothetical protein
MVLKHLKNKKGNAYAALVVISLVAVLFLGYWVMMGPFSKIFNMFMDDTKYNTMYLDEESCPGYWVDGQCNQLPDRAKSLLYTERKIWLVVPFIAVLGFILWFWTVTFKDDYQRFQ